MSSTLARRTVIAVSIDGADISEDANRYLISLSYTDNEEDKADDLQLALDDREGVWLENWLDSADGTKGAEISAVIIQRNWESDGSDRVLACGVFEVDTLDGSGFPSAIAIKGTSLPFSSVIRTATHTKAWENTTLAALAGEMAARSGMRLMYESSYNPLYDRKEQVELSDICFLQGLCYDAGISLKVSGGIVVLFDAAEYERKPAVTTIRKGTTGILGYRFGTSTNDTNYARCHVSYTNPRTGETLEATFERPGADPEGQTLKVNERVTSVGEALSLAMRRLRHKNKGETKAEFSLAGDTRLVSGVTVDVAGWGMFDGKYIIASATHSLGGDGYRASVRLRKVLEGY